MNHGSSSSRVAIDLALAFLSSRLGKRRSTSGELVLDVTTHLSGTANARASSRFRFSQENERCGQGLRSVLASLLATAYTSGIRSVTNTLRFEAWFADSIRSGLDR